MDLRARKNIRLQGYDYSQNGAYFITVCIKDRHHLLWDDLENDDQIVVGANCVRPGGDGLTDCGRTQFAPTTAGNQGNEGGDGLTNCGRTQFAPTGEPPQLSDIGATIDNEINKIPEIYKNVKIDKYVIMPNHIHMIVLIDGFRAGLSQTVPGYVQTLGCRGELCSPAKETPTISRIMKQFKGSISKQIGFSIWQKSFHDHIIRNDEEYNIIWQYIDENPVKWQDDCYYDETNAM